MFKRGGIYLDSNILTSLDSYLQNEDEAVITREKNHQNLFAQWALIFDKGHSFLQKTIEYIIDNIENNRYPHDVHVMTRPTVYSKAINAIISESPSVKYRIVPDDYKGFMKFKYKLGKLLIYRNRANHWKKLQLRIPVLKNSD